MVDKANKKKKEAKKKVLPQKTFRNGWDLFRDGNLTTKSFVNVDPRIFRVKYDLLQDGSLAYPLGWVCAQEPSLDVVECVHQQHPQAISNNDVKDSKLPLHYACQYGASMEVIEYLMKEYPEGITQGDMNGDLPLHYACGTQLKWTGSEPLEQVKSKKKQQRKSKKKQKAQGDEEMEKPQGPAKVRGPRMELIQSLMLEYPEGVKVQNKDGWLPLHTLCAFQPDFEAICFLLSQYAEGCKVETSDGLLPEDLLAAGDTQDDEEQPPGSPPRTPTLSQDIAGLMEYVRRRLDDPRVTSGLPKTRFALEWDVLRHEVTKDLAEASEDPHIIQSGILASRELSYLFRLRQFYPTRQELQSMAKDEDSALCNVWCMDKSTAMTQLYREIEEAGAIPGHSRGIISEIKGKIKALDDEMGDPEVPLDRKLGLANEIAELEIQLYVERKRRVTCIGDDNEESENTDVHIGEECYVESGLETPDERDEGDEGCRSADFTPPSPSRSRQSSTSTTSASSIASADNVNPANDNASVASKSVHTNDVSIESAVTFAASNATGLSNRDLSGFNYNADTPKKEEPVYLNGDHSRRSKPRSGSKHRSRSGSRSKRVRRKRSQRISGDSSADLSVRTPRRTLL